MRDPDAFDTFYKETRERLLLQTYALTGDLSASKAAVRDAFVLAWHHWRKVERLEDPETSVRPNAWRHAQRRHTARLWHRDKGLDPEVKETFDILGQLTMRQRKALLLTQVANASIPQMAREIGLPLDEAERELQDAVGEFTRLREVPTVGIRDAFAPIERAIADTRFPRATIIRRAGAARRRTHTTVGAVAAVAVFLVSGTLVTDAAGVRPSLDRAAAGNSPDDERPRRAHGPGPAERPRDRRPARHLLPRPHVERGTAPTPTPRGPANCSPASGSRTPTRTAPRRWCGTSPARARSCREPRLSRWSRRRRLALPPGVPIARWSAGSRGAPTAGCS